MRDLRELQRRFCAALYDDASDPTTLGIRHRRGVDAAQRLALYRNSMRGILTKALADVFPVVRQLVGERFFGYLGHHFMRRYPSRSGDLHCYGERFPGFIAAFGPASTLPYLADVAKLEWACHCVFHAADHAPMSLAELAAVPQERHDGLRFELHPAAQLLHSPYPVHRIWQLHLSGCQAQVVNLNEGPAWLLVVRRAFEVNLETLSAAEFAFLAALSEGGLQDACQMAAAVDACFEPALVLRRLIANATLVRFRIDNDEGE